MDAQAPARPELGILRPGAAAGDDFQARLTEVDPALQDFSYAPESYDATVLVALAANAAKNDSGTGIASQMQAVSEGGEKCTSYQQCLDLLNAVLVDADGGLRRVTVGIYQYGADNKYTNVAYQEGSLS